MPFRSIGAPTRAAVFKALREALLVLIALSCYLAVRLLVRDAGPQALANAGSILRFERALHLSWELPVQAAMFDHAPLIRALNWVYIWGYWPVLLASLCYLYLRHRRVYRHLRTAIIVSGAIGLLLFLSFPVAPPRLADVGLRDTIERYDPGYQGVARPGRLTNQFAAMPSFHFGWDLLCGVSVAAALRRRVLRALAIAAPFVMALAIIVTGNHYIVDAVAGGFLALSGLALSRWSAGLGSKAPRVRPRVSFAPRRVPKSGLSSSGGHCQ